MGGVQIDDVAEKHFLGNQRVMTLDDGTDGQRAFADAADHHLAAGFDALGNGDFALAGKKLDRAHFPQVHADRVVGSPHFGFIDVAGLAFGGFFFGAGLGGGGFLAVIALDDVNAHFRKHGHGVFDLLGRDLIGR